MGAREIGNGYPASWVLQEQNNRHWVRVQRNERDDRPREIELKMSKDWRADFIKRSNAKRSKRLIDLIPTIRFPGT